MARYLKYPLYRDGALFIFHHRYGVASTSRSAPLLTHAPGSLDGGDFPTRSATSPSVRIIPAMPTERATFATCRLAAPSPSQRLSFHRDAPVQLQPFFAAGSHAETLLLERVGTYLFNLN